MECLTQPASGGFILVALGVVAVLSSWGTWWLMRNKAAEVAKLEDAARDFDDKRRG